MCRFSSVFNGGRPLLADGNVDYLAVIHTSRPTVILTAGPARVTQNSLTGDVQVPFVFRTGARNGTPEIEAEEKDTGSVQIPSP